MTRLQLPVLLLCLAAVAGALGLIQERGAGGAAPPPVPPTAGREVPHEDCLLENGWNICNYGDAALKDLYLRYRPYLGEPVSGFDSRCQRYRLGALCYNPGNPDGWKIEFANLGLSDYLANGFSPQASASPHPAVRDWLLAQMEVGLDTTRVVGPMVSQPHCDQKTARCMQWTAKTKFTFPIGAVSADQVQRVPLGLPSIQASAPALRQPASAPGRWLPRQWPFALSLICLVGLGLLSLTSRRAGSAGDASATI